MARILAIDFGTKRTGIATTDPLQIISSPLDTFPTDKVINFLKDYFFTEEVERIIIGEPKKLDDTEAEILPKIRLFAQKLTETFPNIPIEWQDERFTSLDAQRIILASGIPKMKRRDKGLVDKVSASIILEEWMKANGRWT
jgi:putative holliday junction resolvase